MVISLIIKPPSAVRGEPIDLPGQVLPDHPLCAVLIWTVSPSVSSTFSSSPVPIGALNPSHFRPALSKIQIKENKCTNLVTE